MITLLYVCPCDWLVWSHDNITVCVSLWFISRLKAKSQTLLPVRLQEMYDAVSNYQDPKGRELAVPFLKLPLKTVSSIQLWINMMSMFTWIMSLFSWVILFTWVMYFRKYVYVHMWNMSMFIEWCICTHRRCVLVHIILCH